MHRLKLRPLKEDYKFLEIRATQLGGFVNPPMYVQHDPVKMNEITLMGDMIHNIVQTCLFSGYEHARHICSVLEKEVDDYQYWAGFPDIWKKFHKNIFNYAELARQYSEMLPAPVICIEKEYRIYVECSSYLVCLGGCSDAILEDGTVIDIKSAAKPRDDVKQIAERQQYYYTLMNAYGGGKQESPNFHYAVFTKHSPPRLQVIERETNLEKSLNTLQTDLFMYLSNLSNVHNQKQTDGVMSKTKEERGEVQNGKAGFTIQEQPRGSQDISIG